MAAALLRVDSEPICTHDPRHPDRIHEVPRVAAASVDLGSRTATPGSVAVSTLQGTASTAADVAVTAALAEKHATTQTLPRRDLIFKALALACTTIPKCVGDAHRCNLTLAAQASVEGIAKRFKVQRCPLRIVAAPRAKANTAATHRLDVVGTAWHTPTHRDRSVFFARDEWRDLAHRAPHSMAMLGAAQDNQSYPHLRGGAEAQCRWRLYGI